VEEGVDLAKRERAGSPGGGLAMLCVVDHDRLGAAQGRTGREFVHPRARRAGGAGEEALGQEEPEPAAVGVEHLEDPHVGVVAGHGRRRVGET